MEDFITIAQTLPMGHHTRSDCECGKGNTLIINHNQKFYSAHCFRCDFNKFHDKGVQTLAELAHIRELNEAAAAYQPSAVVLPEDFTTDIPLEGRLWLYGGGTTPTDWKKYGIGYSPALKRVVLPVYNAQRELVWFQCRSVLKGMKPKYIQPSRERSQITFFASPEGADLSRAVVVEDILSAIRVGKMIPTYSLLGTKITDGQATLLSKYDHVYTWMDNDAAGKGGSKNIRQTLGLITEVSDIRTADDPKKLTNQKIKEMLCLAK